MDKCVLIGHFIGWPRKQTGSQILKIERYGKGLTPTVSMGDGGALSWAPCKALSGTVNFNHYTYFSDMVVSFHLLTLNAHLRVLG